MLHPPVDLRQSADPPDGPTLLPMALLFLLRPYSTYYGPTLLTMALLSLLWLYLPWQSEDAQMAVVGLTSRYDAVELLEKRVRSRFSQASSPYTTPHPHTTNPPTP